MSSYIEAISQASTASGTTSKKDATGDASMGKEDFLKLLVAQLQNQDPLNPDDATEFTAQLAQFSSLEQLFTLNEGMQTLVTSNTNSDRLSTLSTIGKDVTYQADKFNFSGDPVEVGYQLDGSASEVTLALQLNGSTVATLQGTELTKGNSFLTWDGLTKEGKAAPVGEYRIVINAKAVDGENVSAMPLIKSEVTGVDLEGESAGTLLTQAGEIKFSNILGVFDPGTKNNKTSKEEENNNNSVTDSLASAAAVTENINAIVN